MQPRQLFVRNSHDIIHTVEETVFDNCVPAISYIDFPENFFKESEGEVYNWYKSSTCCTFFSLILPRSEWFSLKLLVLPFIVICDASMQWSSVDVFQSKMRRLHDRSITSHLLFFQWFWKILHLHHQSRIKSILPILFLNSFRVQNFSQWTDAFLWQAIRNGCLWSACFNSMLLVLSNWCRMQ